MSFQRVCTSEKELFTAVPRGTVLVLTGSQIRAACALIKLSLRELADASGVSFAAVQRAAAVDDMPNMHTKNLAAIKAALEKHGVVFLDGDYSGRGGPGVRLRK